MEDINFKPNLIKVGSFRIVALSLAIIFAFNILLVLKPNEYANFILNFFIYSNNFYFCIILA